MTAAFESTAGPPLSDRDFEWLRQAANRHSGIQLPPGKRNMIQSRLAKRLRKLGLEDFAAYRQLLERGNDAEFGEFINCLTTNVTSFFREPHHFEHLRKVALPEKTAGGRPRIWSAGCSTGEEPYSITATVLDWAAEARPGLDFRLQATDLDTNVLDKARGGVYPEERVGELDLAWKRRWLYRGAGGFAGQVKVKPALQAPIEFKQWNLVRPWTVPEPFGIVFCRNVVIYFDKATQKTLFDRFANAMEPGGFLYIGHSETLFQVSDRFRVVDKTTYQKK